MVLQERPEATTESNGVAYEVVIDRSDNPDLKLKPRLTANVTIFTLERDDAQTSRPKHCASFRMPGLLGEIVLTAVGTESQAATGAGNCG